MASFAIDVKLWATVYITADSMDAAKAKLIDTFGETGTASELYISIDPQMIQEGVMLSPVAEVIASDPLELVEDR